MPKFKDSKPFSNNRVTHFNAFKFKNSDEKKPKLGILPEHVMSYYRQVSTTLASGFDDEDTSTKDDFLDNVFASLKDDGIQVSQNQTVSRILEALFVHSKPCHLNGLFSQFCKELALVSFDRFASHVFQSLIRYLPQMYTASKLEIAEGKDELKLNIDRLCQFVESHVRDFMTHTYGSHVLRSLLEAVAGVTVKEDIVRSRLSRTQSYANAAPNVVMTKELSMDYHSSFMTLKDKIINLCNYDDHLSDANYCPVLQTVMLILHKIAPEEYKEMAQAFFKRICPTEVVIADDDDVFKRIPALAQNEVGSFLFELLITLVSDAEVEELHRNVFKEKMLYYGVHPIANFVLQKFLTVVSSTVMNDVLEEVSKFFEDVFAMNHIGVVIKLAEACKRNHSGQVKFMDTLMAAFHCHTPTTRQLKVAPLVASLQTYEIFFPENQQSEEGDAPKTPHILKDVNLHGSLLLQTLLHFDKPKLLVSSVLDLSGTELSNLCCDKCGSHVVESFFESTTNRAKNKEELLKKLKGLYINIACNRNGSRCLEGVWKKASMLQKILIAEELLKDQNRLESDKFGHFLYYNFALQKFSQRRSEWDELQGVMSKKRQILKDILEGTSSPKKNKKNKQNRGMPKGQTLNNSFSAVMSGQPESGKSAATPGGHDDAIEGVAYIDRKSSRLAVQDEESTSPVKQGKKRKLEEDSASKIVEMKVNSKKLKENTDGTNIQKSSEKARKKKEGTKKMEQRQNNDEETEQASSSLKTEVKKKKKKKRKSNADGDRGDTTHKAIKVENIDAGVLNAPKKMKMKKMAGEDEQSVVVLKKSGKKKLKKKN